jgi:hypothetical protein
MVKKRQTGVANDHDPAEGMEFDKAAYNQVVDSAQLVTVQLSKVNFSIDGDFYDESTPKKLHFDRGVAGCFFDPEGPSVTGSFKYVVYSKSGRKKQLAADAEFVVIYALAEGADEIAAKIFCRRVGMFAAFPYFRALMANLAWSANAPLPPLPVIATKGSNISVAHAPETND